MSAIRTHRLTRDFGNGRGIYGLDLDVPEGVIYGFLGPNGAGKTTTIRLLLGLLSPDAGEVCLCGRVLARSRREALSMVGAMVETPSLYPHLSVRDNLQVDRRLLGSPYARIDEVLEITGLNADADRRVGELSMGMRQRLGIALALLNRPRLLILDEPTNGLDPAGIAELRHFILRMTRELGLSVFLSSHLLTEVEQVASHVGVVHQGRLLFQGTLQDLHARSPTPLEITCSDSAAACLDLLNFGEKAQIIDGFTLKLPDPQLADYDINRLLVERGHTVNRLARRRRSLESLFFELTLNQEEVA